LSCSFCQNWDISHPPGKEVFGEDVTAEKVIEMAKKRELPGIAYTYTEPTIAYEFYIEIMKLAAKEGLYNVWVSNGYINPEPAKKVAKYLDAINVDLKGDTKFYQKLCGIPSEEPMRTALKIYKKAGVWIEVTNLLIPGYNDKPEQIENLAKWVRENLGKDTPFHLSRFHPSYMMMDTPPTSVETLDKAAAIAKKVGLKWIYVGNVPGHVKETLAKKEGIPIAGKKWIKT
jgi:pyruvate formate lyase activating enzyme